MRKSPGANAVTALHCCCCGSDGGGDGGTIVPGLAFLGLVAEPEKDQ